MPSKSEQILEKLKSLLVQGCSATVERNSALPEEIPDEGLLIIFDGDPGEPERVLGGFDNVYYQHDIELMLFVDDGDPVQRDQKFDALAGQVGTVLAANPDLEGLVAGLTYARPEVDIEPVLGGPAIKTGTIIITADYESATPLS